MNLTPAMMLSAALALPGLAGQHPAPASQNFLQEMSSGFSGNGGMPAAPVQLLDYVPPQSIRALVSGSWLEFSESGWHTNLLLQQTSLDQFTFSGATSQPTTASVPWHEVRQLKRVGTTAFVATATQLLKCNQAKCEGIDWPADRAIRQIAVSPEGQLAVASAKGLFESTRSGWVRAEPLDSVGRQWAVGDVLGVAYDSQGSLWFASRAGVGVRKGTGWSFYEAKDGLPWNDFTCAAAGSGEEVWFGTRLGAIRFDGHEWQYRQGRCWLPNDEISTLVTDEQGRTWFGTASGVGNIYRSPMTLEVKARFYEEEIEKYIKRTPFGFVAEASLQKLGDRSSADPQDSDNDGLWTSMYGAGECFGWAATKNPACRERARKAFEALRFLQQVTQGGDHAPPKGYIARTIRPVEWPDPNVGRLAADKEGQKSDKLWKAYEPRWPKSADGRWFWKSDTSSDELDGHYFFYGLYYDLCASEPGEQERVREVVRGITDHLLEHRYVLIDHDGKPTRWAVYGPDFLNQDPRWWQERGLKSLSMLSYLAVAAHVTGDSKYSEASRRLIDEHSYAHNAMYAKVQHGPGSGNQSDDEMGFMCFYSLLRCSNDERLKNLIRLSFYGYWVNEGPEKNPFFNFAYAACNLGCFADLNFGRLTLDPWKGWHEDSIATLRGFPMDRRNWGHLNSHRLDVVGLPAERSADLDEPDPPRRRGHLINGKVLPVENRHFGHWNTDPWQLDYAGNGEELSAGTVFLLPYYMGLYHHFIETPK